MEPICGNKYKISPNNTICLPVRLEDLPPEIEIFGKKLYVKTSFHVSLVCINEIIKKQQITIPNFKDSVLSDFCDFISKNPINFVNYSNQFKYCEKDILKTVIVLCTVSSLDKFFEFLNKKYGLNLECPPMHVTLYAHDGKTGIFLTDSSDINNLTKPIPNPTGVTLHI